MIVDKSPWPLCEGRKETKLEQWREGTSESLSSTKANP